jgi:hypothetical protein
MADRELIAATLTAGILSSVNTVVSLNENGARVAVQVYRQVLAGLEVADHPSIDWEKEVLGRPITVRSMQDHRTGRTPLCDQER